MKKIFSFARKKSKGLSPSTSETASVLSVGYELKDKDLSKLHRAAASGDVSKIKQLLRKQDINQLDKENRTPLHLACANGHPDAVSVLVESKSKLNLCDNDCRSALMKAVQCQQELCATILLQHEADPNLVDVNGNSALHFAAQIPSIQIATELLEHGGNINAGNRDKCTPLILAVSENHQDMVEFLIKEGADVNAKDVNNRTSLMIASSNGYISLVRLFLQHGADVSLKDKDGWTADDHAVMNGHHACSHLIIEHSARKQPSTSPPFYGTSKARGASSISSPERIVEGGFVLGGPAKDKEELQLTSKQKATARNSGKVTEDISQAESVSRASGKSADVDSWPSDEDDLDFFPQTPPKPSLKQLLNTKENVNEKGRVTTAQPIAFALQNKDSDEDSLNGSEKEDAIKFPLPKPLSQVRAYPQPGYFKPGSFTELPQMNSSPILSLNKEEDTYSESDGKNSDSEEGSSDREDLPRPSFKAHYKSEEKLQNLETPNDRKVELMSELGLEDDDIESPWDSESASESPRKQSASPSPLSAVPSHMQCISEVSNEDSSEKSTSLEIKQPLKLFPEGKVVLPVAKGDVMADLGLDDADDIEEPTDWDSSSHSKSITHNNSTTSISLQKLNKEQTGSKTGSKEKLTATTTLYTVPEPEIENHIHSGKTGSELNASKKVLQQLHDLGDDISNRNMLNNADCKTEVDEKQSDKNVHVTGDGDKNSLGMKTDVSELQSKQNNEPKHNSLQGVTGKYINEKEQAENTEDLDDFSQSSDTGTEECELSSSTFRNAMLLIDQLNCEGPDSLNLLKIKNIIHEYEKGIQRENGRYTFLLQKVKKLQSEKKSFQQTFDSNRELKSKLEHHTVEWESELNNLRFTLEQEVERRRSVELLYDKSKVQLRKKEDQCCKQVEEKQQLELTLRNLDLEMKSLMSSMKQIEEERNETQRLLSQERNARRLQEAALNNLMKKSETEENRKTLTKSTELSSKPSETSEQEKKTAKDTLQQEVSALMLELEQVRSHNQEVETQYTEENIVLKEKIEDLRRDLKMNEETLTQTIIQYNGQLNALKTETAMLYSKLDHEKQNKERLETELDSICSRLTFTTQELEKNQTLKTEAERSLQRERDEWIRSRDKLNNELSNIHEKNSNLSQQLSKVETKSNSLECDLHKTTLCLQEKTLLLETTQRDLTQASCRINDLEHTLQIEKDQINKSSVKQESLKERFDQSVSENLLLRQQLEELQNKGIVKEKTLSEVQERFSDMYNKLRADTERQVHIVEERNKDLINKSDELREQIYKLETEKVERESALRQLQQELADALKKLSMSEASLEVITRYRNDLEEEKQYLQKELEKHRNKLEGLDEQLSLSQRCNHQFKNMIEDKEREVAAATQKVQELSAAAAGTQNAVKQLEEHVQKLEIENAKFEATIKQQNGQIEILQKELQESLLIRNRMEDLITTLQSSKIDLEEKLNCQVHKQNTLSQNAQDSHNLWEEELKSKSRLGIRLAELSHDKSELADQVESEKRKLKKSLELKRSIEARLDQEMKRNNDLQREVSGLKKLLKAAKKKLKEYDAGIAHQSSNQEVSKNKYLETESEVAKFKEKNKELSLQLDRESLKYRQLESTNRELREEVYSLKNFQKHHNQQEKSSRLLEAEVADLKRHVESNKADQSLMEKYKREIEERARQELCQKLEEVNLFLQRQAASQETLEQIRAESYASLKNQLEHRIQDLELELKMKNTQQENLCQKESFQTELDRYKDLYSEELKARKALTSKLDRANDRLSEVNAKLLNERQRNNSLITSCIVNGTLPANPVLDASQLGNMCGNLTLNRSFGLGDHHLNSSGNGMVASQEESYLVKMQHEMNKNITKELDQAYAELETGSTRVSPVGSTVGSLRNLNTDQDPVSRATQQYLEVLKKNYMI